VGQHDGVVVDVNDARARLHRLCHLVHVAHARQPGTEVEELGDPCFLHQVPDGAAEEGPVLPHRRPKRRRDRERLLGDLPVGGEIVLAAEEVVVHPGRVRPGRVDLRRNITVAHVRHLSPASECPAHERRAAELA
jgi:hypothetical protein